MKCSEKNLTLPSVSWYNRSILIEWGMFPNFDRHAGDTYDSEEYDCGPCCRKERN